MTITTFILTGPQGIGKTRRGPKLSTLLGVQFLDDWNGLGALPAGTLAATQNPAPRMVTGAVLFSVVDEAGLDALESALSDSLSPSAS